jgi:hypothetical protein
MELVGWKPNAESARGFGSRRPERAKRGDAKSLMVFLLLHLADES